MTLYGYARVSVREPEDKNLDLQVERLVRVGCSLGNIRAEEAVEDELVEVGGLLGREPVQPQVVHDQQARRQEGPEGSVAGKRARAGSLHAA